MREEPKVLVVLGHPRRASLGGALFDAFCAGLGELDVALTHSIGVILCGYVFHGGGSLDPLPWLLGLPLMVAILPAITLSGVPDLDADRAAGKRTLTVALGPRGAIGLAFALAPLIGS